LSGESGCEFQLGLHTQATLSAPSASKIPWIRRHAAAKPSMSPPLFAAHHSYQSPFISQPQRRKIGFLNRARLRAARRTRPSAEPPLISSYRVPRQDSMGTQSSAT
jgi:hypothetical protein